MLSRGSLPQWKPGNRVVWWLAGVAAAFGCDVAIGDVFLPLAENHWGVTSSSTAAVTSRPLRPGIPP